MGKNFKNRAEAKAWEESFITRFVEKYDTVELLMGIDVEGSVYDTELRKALEDDGYDSDLVYEMNFDVEANSHDEPRI